jgi:hypothetical protein
MVVTHRAAVASSSRIPVAVPAAAAVAGNLQKQPHQPAHGQNLCGGPKPPASLYSAPSDNKCKSFGGCAVPISASQLFPSSGAMQLYNFADTPEHKSEPLPASDNLNFANGDAVYDIAWAAYQRVMKERGLPVADKPAPTDLRIAMPPST